MKRGIFHKYLMGFTTFFLVPMIVLSICLQVVMYRNLNREIIVYNQNILERMGDDLVTMNGRLMEAGNKISFSGAVVSNDHSKEKQIGMVSTLRENNADNSYFSKAYIIYKDQDISYSSQGIYKKDVMVSSQLRLPMQDRETFLNWLYQTDKPSYEVINKEYESREGTVVRPQMIFVYPVYNYSNEAESWIILELQSSKLEFSMETTPGIYSSSITVMNKDGRVLISEGDGSDVSTVKEWFPGLEEGVCSDVKIDGENRSYIVYPLENLNLVLVNQIMIPGLLTNVIKNNSILVSGVVIFLIIGCMLAIYMAYHYYKPIRQLAQYMKQDGEQPQEENELAFIKSRYDSLNSVKETLLKEIEHQWPFVEERLVTKLLYSGTESGEKDIVGSVLEERMNHQKHLVALITGYKLPESRLSELYRKKEQEIRHMFDGEYMVYTSYIYYYEAIAVIVSSEELSSEAVLEVKQRLKQLFHEESYIISSGNIHEDASGVHISYLEALTSMRYRLLNPHKNLQLEFDEGENGEEYSSKLSRYQTENLLCIRSCFEKQDKSVIEKASNEIFLNLEELPGQMAVMSSYDILNHLVKEVKKRNLQLSDGEWYKLAIFRTVEEFCGKLKEILYKISDMMEESQLESVNDLAKQILDYIDLNYRDSNLCLTAMAEHFGYSSSHLSKFITQSLNTSFSELVSVRRLNYTKDCLIHTDKQIAQIAQEAGYVNLSNFIRRFKSSENMTSGQYRAFYQTAD